MKVKVQLGFQTRTTCPSSNLNSAAFWNEDLMFAVAKPFENQLVLPVEDRGSTDKDQVRGKMQIVVGTIERQVNYR